MANAAKIVERMKNNPRDWRVEDLKVVAGHFGHRLASPRHESCGFHQRPRQGSASSGGETYFCGVCQEFPKAPGGLNGKEA
jgi:hypothetical protein